MSKVVKGLVIAAAITLAIPFAAVVAPGLLTAGFVSTVNALALGAFVSGITAQLAGGAGGATVQRPSASVEYSGTVEPRRIIYGKIKAAGMNAIPPVTSGIDNGNLHQVSVIAGHEVNAITDVYFNQELIPSASIGAVTGSFSDGLVSTGTFASKANIRRYLGTSTQTADYILDNELAIWTTSHMGRGVAYIATRFLLDATVYKAGKPDVTAMVEGKKVYDPRLDSTNGGVGSQRVADPTTWTFSNNPALCLADYIIDGSLGVGEDSARVDWALVITAANICDELVTVPNGFGGSLTQKRYTSNVALYAASAYEDNISVLVGAMLGSCLYSGGKWRIKAGAWESATFSIGDANVIGNGIEVSTAYPYKDRYNGIRGSFIDPSNNWQASEFPATASATFASADGETVFKDVRLDACTDVHEAQRMAILLTRKSRNGMLVSVSCDMSLFKVRPGETGVCSITELGWSSQLVRCEGWKFNPAGFVELVLREENAADWNDPVLTDYTTPLNISNPTPVSFRPDPPSGLVVTPTTNAIYLTWVAPANMPYSAQYEVWEYTASTPFSSATKVWSGTTTTCTLPKTDNVTRYYWVLVRMPDGTASDTYPSSAGSGGSAGSIFYGYLTLPAITLAADSAGVVASYAAATGTYKTYSSGVDVTIGSGVVYALVSSTGCTATIDASTGVYSVSAMSTDNATAVFSATYNSVTIQTTFALSKGRAGASGASAPTAYLTVPSVTLFSYTNGSIQSYSAATGSVKVFSGGADVTASSTFAVAAQTACTGTVNASGVYSVTNVTADNAELRINATYGGVTMTLVFAISVVKVGYEIVSALPSTNLFEGRLVYLTTDNKLYRYDGAAWTKAVDGADIQANSILTNSIGAGQITVALLASDSVTAVKIQANTITANKFLTDQGVDLAAIVSGALNTIISASQSSLINEPAGTDTIFTRATSASTGANSRYIQYVKFDVSIRSRNDSTPSGGSGSAYVKLQYSTDGGTNWIDSGASAFFNYVAGATTYFAASSVSVNVGFLPVGSNVIFRLSIRNGSGTAVTSSGFDIQSCGYDVYLGFSK
jgi:hypothetical protein